MNEEPRGIHVPKGPTGTWVPRYPLQAGADATGSSQKALRALYRSLLGLCQVVQTMPGAKRPDLDYVAADLWEVGVLLGEVTGNFAKPVSAWPEGEAGDDGNGDDAPERSDDI